MKIIKKLILNFKSKGFLHTFKKIFTKFYDIISLNTYKKNKIKKLFLSKNSIEEKFEIIYKTNYWSDDKSKSGAGSNFESTRGIKEHLPFIIQKFKIETIFDAPCGDFSWMKQILNTTNVNYHGSDIVTEIVDDNIKKFLNKNIYFSKKNIILDKLPDCDLMICRDCLFHFSNEDIFLFLENFLSSNIKFLLTTSHLNDNNNFKNINIETGDFRYLDLFSEPFNITREHIYTFDDRDYLEINNFKQMYLFSRDQIKKRAIK